MVNTDTAEVSEVVYQVSKQSAEKTDVDICELPPLYDSIDPDALDAFLRCSNSTDTHLERSVEFSYCGYRVRVDSTGQVQFDPEPESKSTEAST